MGKRIATIQFDDDEIDPFMVQDAFEQLEWDWIKEIQIPDPDDEKQREAIERVSAKM
jgi:hypothetical protein